MARKRIGDGAALRLTIALVSVGPSCTPLAGHAVISGTAMRRGASIYDLAETSYLRAVGVTDSAGKRMIPLCPVVIPAAIRICISKFTRR